MIKLCQLSILWVFVFCDNIEISVQDFDALLIGNRIIKSKDIQKCNSIKISYSGLKIYRLTEVANRVYYLKDVTKYFDKVASSTVRIDYEYKYYGMIVDAWIMVCVIFSIALYCLSVKRLIVGRLDFSYE